jgi:hypothetical protein
MALTSLRSIESPRHVGGRQLLILPPERLFSVWQIFVAMDSVFRQATTIFERSSNSAVGLFAIVELTMTRWHTFRCRTRSWIDDIVDAHCCQTSFGDSQPRPRWGRLWRASMG